MAKYLIKLEQQGDKTVEVNFPSADLERVRSFLEKSGEYKRNDQTGITYSRNDGQNGTIDFPSEGNKIQLVGAQKPEHLDELIRILQPTNFMVDCSTEYFYLAQLKEDELKLVETI